MVLGIQWLQTLGTYSTNHQKQFISFMWEGQKHKLYGFQAPKNQIVSSSKMMKMIRKGALAYIVQCHRLELLSAKMISEGSPEVQWLIQKLEKVVQDLPMKMPPNREIEHTIEVKAGSDPVNLKPHHYPHHQKTELEKIIQDLLKCGVVSKSKIPPLGQPKHFVKNTHRYVCFEDKTSFERGAML